MNPQLVENREMTLIALFDLEDLLNRQMGGKYVSWVPFYDDMRMFNAISPLYFQRLQLDGEPASDSGHASDL